MDVIPIDKPQYNTQRKSLIIPEYGRHVQKMIDRVVEITDSEDRKLKSLAIMQVMGNLNIHQRDIRHFQQKLWNQLVIMSDFKLEAPSEELQPSKELLHAKPQKLPYPKKSHRYRFYGNNVKRMIDIAKTWEDSDLKDYLIYTIANHMKKNYLNYNKDTVKNQVITEHLYELSNGELSLNQKFGDLLPTENLLKTKSRENRTQNIVRNKSRKRKGKFRKH